MVIARRSIGCEPAHGLGQGLLQAIEAQPERAGQLERRHDVAGLRHLRRFQMRAADVEAR